MTIPIEGQTLEALTTFELEDLYQEDLACEGPNHPKQRFGHRLPAPAEYLVRHLCGHQFNMCAPWVAALGGYTDTRCGRCGFIHPIAALVVIPL